MTRTGWLFSNPPNTQFRLNRQSPQAIGLLAWWPSLGNNGTFALRDYTRNGNDATSSVAVARVAHGRMGVGLDYTAAVNGFNAGTLTQNIANSAWTFAAWIAPDAFSADTIFNVGNGFSSNTTLHVRLEAATTVRLGLYFNDMDATVPNMTNQLVHVVAMMDSANVQSVYTDGVFRNSRNASSAYTGNALFNLGALAGGDRYDGRMFDARLYNRALSPAEVLHLYQYPYDLYQPIPRLWPVGIAVAAGGGDAVIDVQAGTLTLAGQAATVQSGAVTVSTQSGALAIAGQSASVTPGAVTVAVGVGALALAGQDATPLLGRAYYIAPTGNDTTGDGSEGNPWLTISKINTTLTAGDVGIIAPGNYTGTSNKILPSNSGVAGNPITYRASAPGVSIADPDASNVSNVADLRNRSYITLEGINFLSTASSWVLTSTTSTHIWVINCGFDSAVTGAAFAFSGVYLRGDYARVHNCRFGKWCGGDAVVIEGDYAWVKGNDMNYADAGHGVIVIYGDYFVAEENYVRNKWARPAHFAPAAIETGAHPVHGVVQNNIFFDCNPIADVANEGYPIEGWALTQGDGLEGDAQMLKLGGDGLIFRNNLVVAMNTGTLTFTSHAYKAVIQIDNYDSTVYYQKGRFYHNTIFDNPFNGVSVTENTGHAFEFDDNRFLNNIIADCVGGLSFRMTANTGGYLNTFQWRNNLLTESLRRIGTTYTAENYDIAFPSQASGNISTAPTFVDDDYSAALADRDLRISRDNFLLQAGSAGEGAGRHLATVASNSSGTTITLGAGEALFFTDGNGLIAGDEISINGNVRTVIGIPAENQITVDSALSVTTGQNVYLTLFGTSPNMGIVALTEDEGEGPAVELEAPIVLNTVTATNTAATTTSGTISPSANALLVVVFSANNVTSGPTVTPVNISSTFSPALTFTQYERDGSGINRPYVAIFVAQTGSAPGSGTVTITTTNNGVARVLSVLEIGEGFDTTTPVAQSKTGETFSTTAKTITLDATPDTTSLVLAAIGSRGSGISVTHDADFAELVEQMASTVHVQQIQYDLHDALAATTWGGTLGASGTVGVVLEVAVQEWDVPTPVVVSASPGTLTLSGQAVTVQVGAVAVSVSAGALALTGQSASVQSATEVAASTGALALVGQAAAVTPGNVSIAVGVGALALAGQAAIVSAGDATVTVNSGLLSLTGQQATVQPGAVTIAVGVASLTVTGQQPTILLGATSIEANPAQLALAGQQASVVVGAVAVVINAGALTLAPQSAVATPGAVTIDAQPGALTSSGQQASADVGTVVNVAAGLLSFAGQQAAVQPGAVIVVMSIAALSVIGRPVVGYAGELIIPVRAVSVYGPNPLATVYGPNPNSTIGG